MVRMSITVDESMLEQAREALGVRTKAEAVRAALEDVLRRKRRDAALANQGRIPLGIDRKRLKRLRASR